MLGRGALCWPDLPRLVAGRLLATRRSPCTGRRYCCCCCVFELNLTHYDARFAPNLLKQWLVYLRAYFPQAALLFEQVKRLRDPAQLAAARRHDCGNAA